VIASLDITFSGHRTQRTYSYSRVGGHQPKLRAELSKYTNAILTCVWSDGVDRTPACLFTFNPGFRLDVHKTQLQQSRFDYLTQCLKDAEVSEGRVVFCGSPPNDKRTYVSEDARIVQWFIGKYREQFQKADIVLSDNGAAFQNMKSKWFHETDAKVFYYPASVHQYMSPNDNKLHGAAKGQWRNMGLDFKDDVKSSIMLLNCIDQVASKNTGNVVKWFKDNLFLKSDNFNLSSVQELISGRTGEQQSWYRHCIRKYEVYMETKRTGKDASALGGIYWES
jgi:hypothetical protein